MLDRIESFPFDSAFTGYDNSGYPIYDRAVGANILSDIFGKFFSDGVFQTEPSSLYISKSEGMSITVSPGMAIIKGGMGDLPKKKTYALEPAIGRVAYGVYVRRDDNDEARSLYIRIDHGEAGDNPLPPEPVNTAAIKEYRLGYVVVPVNATDLSEATVVNEQGLATCPYAAPFVEIDVSQVIKDVKDASQAQYEIFIKYLNDNKDLIDSALEGTVLQTIMTQIENCVKKDTLDSRNLEYDSYGKLGLASGAVDNDTLEFNENRAVKISAAFVKKIDDIVEEVTKPKPGENLDDYTWSEIAALSEQAKSNPSAFTYMLGATKPVLFQGHSSVDMQLIGIAHDDLSDGSGKAGFTFMSKQILMTHRMNASNTTSGGWANSEMKSFMTDTLLPTLPQIIRLNMKQVKKKYCDTTNFNSLSTSNDKLFLASEIEVFGTTTHGAEGSQYQYWSEHNNNAARVKFIGDATSHWWLRSVWDGSTFCIVGTDGSLYCCDASLAAGVVPCFCI